MERWLRIASLLLFVAAWHITSVLGQSEVLPSPLTVLNSLIGHLNSGELLFHLGKTLQRVLFAFTLALFLGSVAGLFMGRGKLVNAALDGLLILALNVPALVTIILCYIWFGLTEVAAVLAVAINKVPTVAVTVREGARALDERLLDVGRVYRVGRWKFLRHIILPQMYPYLVASARSGLALIWKIVLVVELLGRSNGVGFQLGTFFNFFDIASILAYTVAFALVIFLIEILVLQPLDRHAARWRT